MTTAKLLIVEDDGILAANLEAVITESATASSARSAPARRPWPCSRNNRPIWCSWISSWPAP
jgi:hypothetical protein